MSKHTPFSERAPGTWPVLGRSSGLNIHNNLEVTSCLVGKISCGLILLVWHHPRSDLSLDRASSCARTTSG